MTEWREMTTEETAQWTEFMNSYPPAREILAAADSVVRTALVGEMPADAALDHLVQHLADLDAALRWQWPFYDEKD